MTFPSLKPTPRLQFIPSVWPLLPVVGALSRSRFVRIFCSLGSASRTHCTWSRYSQRIAQSDFFRQWSGMSVRPVFYETRLAPSRNLCSSRHTHATGRLCFRVVFQDFSVDPLNHKMLYHTGVHVHGCYTTIYLDDVSVIFQDYAPNIFATFPFTFNWTELCEGDGFWRVRRPIHCNLFCCMN